MQRIQFNEWLPDQPELLGAGLFDAKNCLPASSGYQSFPGLAPFTDAIGSACLGAYWAKAADGLYYNFAGTAAKLYKLNSDTWEDASRVGDYSGVTNWEMARFGERVIAVALGEDTQAYDMGTDTDFADLAGSPPQAGTICVAGDFVVLGDLIEGSTAYPSRVRWCGYNDTEWWTTSIQRQSDFQDIYGEGGRVQRLVPVPNGAIIFMERAIHRMTYVGPPVIFRVDEVEPDRGTPAKNSVCWRGSRIFFYSEDGFQELRGGQVVPIGDGKVNEWFAENTDAVDSLRGAVDARSNRVVWTFRSSSSLTYQDRAIVYHIPTGRWSWAEIDTEVVALQAQGGASLDGLDAILGTDIDANAFTVDDPAYQGGRLRLVAFDTDHKLGTFSGSELQATFETSELGGEAETLFVRASRPLIQGTATFQVSIGTRDAQNEAVVFSAQSPAERNGEHPHRSKGRYVRARVTTSGAFKRAIGIGLELSPAGKL